MSQLSPWVIASANVLNPVLLPTRTVTAPNGVATALPVDIPTTVDVLLIQSDKDVRFNDDGTTAPTGTTGILLPANTPMQYAVPDFAQIQFITAAGVVGDATINLLGYSR